MHRLTKPSAVHVKEQKAGSAVATRWRLATMHYRDEGVVHALRPRVRLCDPVEFSHPARQFGSLLLCDAFHRCRTRARDPHDVTVTMLHVRTHTDREARFLDKCIACRRFRVSIISKRQGESACRLGQISTRAQRVDFSRE